MQGKLPTFFDPPHSEREKNQFSGFPELHAVKPASLDSVFCTLGPEVSDSSRLRAEKKGTFGASRRRALRASGVRRRRRRRPSTVRPIRARRVPDRRLGRTGRRVASEGRGGGEKKEKFFPFSI